MSIAKIVPVIVAPLAMILLSVVTAYVAKIGKPHTGIYFDYVIFVLVIAMALVAGGAL